MPWWGILAIIGVLASIFAFAWWKGGDAIQAAVKVKDARRARKAAEMRAQYEEQRQAALEQAQEEENAIPDDGLSGTDADQLFGWHAGDSDVPPPDPPQAA